MGGNAYTDTGEICGAQGVTAGTIRPELKALAVITR